MNVPVTPLGSPAIDSVTEPVYPPVSATRIGTLPLCPCASEKDAGAERVNDAVVPKVKLPELEVAPAPFVDVTAKL